MKITIVHKRDYSVANEKTGVVTAGKVYGGFTEENKPIKFTSKISDYAVQSATGYDPMRSIDVNLITKFDEVRGLIKYQEAA